MDRIEMAEGVELIFNKEPVEIDWVELRKKVRDDAIKSRSIKSQGGNK